MQSDLSRAEALAELRNVPTGRELNRRLEPLPVSADAKALLSDLARITLQVGSQIFAVGRKIISFALSVLGAFPSMSFGLVVALVVSALLATIPVLGALLGPVLTPLLVAFGLTQGALNDLRQPEFHARVERLVAQFQTALQPA